MAPEVLNSEPVDFRSDIYSFGAVMYEAATGKRPFTSKNSVVLIAEIINKEPELPQKINSDLSIGFGATIMRCLAKEPGQRYQRASDLRTALETIRDSIAKRRRRQANRFEGYGSLHFVVAEIKSMW